MTALEYAQLVLETRDLFFDKIRKALPVECEMEKRFIQTGVQKEDVWVASLVNHQTGKIRLFVMLMTNLRTADLAATAGAKNFKPSMRLTFELFTIIFREKTAKRRRRSLNRMRSNCSLQSNRIEIFLRRL